MFSTAEFGESEGQVFLSAAAVQVPNIRTLCDVGQNQRQAFLRGQIGGSTAQRAARGPLELTQIHPRLLMTLFNTAMCVDCSGFGRYALWKTVERPVFSVELCILECVCSVVKCVFVQIKLQVLRDHDLLTCD